MCNPTPFSSTLENTQVSENDIVIRITLNPLQFITKAAHSRTLVLILLIVQIPCYTGRPQVQRASESRPVLRAAGRLGKTDTDSGRRERGQHPTAGYRERMSPCRKSCLNYRLKEVCHSDQEGRPFSGEGIMPTRAQWPGCVLPC